MAYTFNYACDEVITLTGLTAGGSALNGATVTYAIKDATGNTVSGGSGTMTATGSGGNYTATIESTVTSLMTVGGYYVTEHVITSGSYNDFRRIRTNVVYRPET